MAQCFSILDKLSKSKFRAKFKLRTKELEYIENKGLNTIRSHACDFIKNSVALTYQNVEKIHDVWAVEGITKQYHSLPAESHNSNAYIKLNNGIFREMRIYDENHLIKYEIAYHKEKNLTGNNHEKVLHIHEYKNGNFDDRSPRLLSNEEFIKYKKYFKGVNL